MTPRLLLIPVLALLLTACDIPGMGPDPRIAMREAEGKAIGGACRYAVRGIEECYQLNPKALKTAIFDGWREMDQYMRDNKIEGQPPERESSESKETAENNSAESKPGSTPDRKQPAASAPDVKPRATDKKAS